MLTVALVANSVIFLPLALLAVLMTFAFLNNVHTLIFKGKVRVRKSNQIKSIEWIKNKKEVIKVISVGFLLMFFTIVLALTYYFLNIHGLIIKH